MSDKPKPPTPEMLFVENTREGIYTLRWRTDTTLDSKITSPGINAIPLAMLAKCLIKGETLDEATNGALREVDVERLSDRDAAALAARSTSRNGLQEWRRVEKREKVLAAIDERLRKAKAA